MDLITKKEAAELLKISESSLNRILAKGTLPSYRVGVRTVRIDRDDIRKYIETRVIAPQRKAVAVPARRPCGYYPGMKVV